MKINGISPSTHVVVKRDPVEPVKQEATKKAGQDKIEISQEAKILKDKSLKINEIKAKVESGFYNSDEVISKVADKILEEFGS